jgi:deoxycytidine triphosphate deaminase
MSLLTDTDLKKIVFSEREWIDKSKLYIHPFDNESLTPIGYDVRVGPQYASAIDAEIYQIGSDDIVIIKPRDIVLITTLEYIGMPNSRLISAFITSKVSNVSKGLSHISTNIDPDWKGPLLIAIHNPSQKTISLKYGARLCTINFIENKSPSTKECGKEPGRSDILLQQFIKDVKKAREKEIIQNKKNNRKIYFCRFSIIFLISLLGYLLFKSTPGFIAMTALGVALSNLFYSRKEL